MSLTNQIRDIFSRFQGNYPDYFTNRTIFPTGCNFRLIGKNGNSNPYRKKYLIYGVLFCFYNSS